MSYPALTGEQPELSTVQDRLSPPCRHLASGPWSAYLVGDELARISYAGRPVLRAVKAVVRDQDWRTPPARLRSVEVTEDHAGLHVRWLVEFTGYGVEYNGVLTALFTRDRLNIEFEGTAALPFRRNRIGLVVLHPPTDAGRGVVVDHPDGGTTQALFPHAISPHQPFMDIAALNWSDAGTAFRLSFSGEVFETEDQRNWTDASYKTYGTPLARPFPVDVAAGDTVRQSVLLQATTQEPADPVPSAAAIDVVTARLGGQAGRVPGLAVAAGTDPELLPGIPSLDAFLVELVEKPGDSPRRGWAAQLQAAAAAAAVQGAGLDIRATTPDPVGAVADLAPYLARAKRLAVFHPASHVTGPDTWPELKAAVREAGYEGELLAGSRSHFTELNRNSGRMPSEPDALTFSITPQMHSTEVAHIVESVPMQRIAAQNALRLGGGRPLHVGPVTLLPRFNAVATSGAAEEAEADELQPHPFAAAWLLASISALTVDGVESVTYFEASGPRGISDRSGRLYPAGRLLKELAGLRGAAVLSVDGDTGPVSLYPVQSPAGTVVFAGNLSASAVGVEICLVDGKAVRQRLALEPWSAVVVRFPASG
ncbi:conserved hypothetical protein [Arthrobacter sp. 9AX]|uniref:hypothetical protein n=1 Tax=Arthrobacter sp. 9AX TaxID=2653131 RepID=UPI0012F1F3F7|nr:hypothetical protein [Arthrobacter sp. 9AX]VXB88396.1 conserved hypothetical protein [Arthrobacter sp. 9AX]